MCFCVRVCEFRKKEILRDGKEGMALEERVKGFLDHLGKMCESEEQKVTVTITMDDFMEALLVCTHLSNDTHTHKQEILMI